MQYIIEMKEPILVRSLEWTQIGDPLASLEAAQAAKWVLWTMRGVLFKDRLKPSEISIIRVHDDGRREVVS